MPSETTDRVFPPCPHFGPCGGCQLQDLAYTTQLDRKAAQFCALFEPHRLALPELQIHPSPPFTYRNRIRLTLAEVDGQLRAGYLRASQTADEDCASSMLPITQCPIAAPILWRAAEAFLTVVARNFASLRNPQQTLDQLELFTTADESHLQLVLYIRTRAKTASAKLAADFDKLCEALRTLLPELTGAGIALLPPASSDRSRRSETPRPGPTWGAPGLNYLAGETSYWVPRSAFFQVNRFLVPNLLDLVISTASGLPLAERNLVWDLYAGVGLFSKPLARTFTSVTAVEIADSAFTALTSTKLPNLLAIKATTLGFLRAAVVQRDSPDLIVLDPPRTGAGPEICALLARVAAPAVIYVSCSPQTLPADLAILAASGYKIAALHLVDLFPQTNHIETVTILRR